MTGEGEPYVSKLGRRIVRASRAKAFARGLRTLARHSWAHASSAALAFVPRVRSVTAGADPCAESLRVAVYVTFDRQGLAADFVVAQVAALAALGRRVIVVSNSPVLSPGAVAGLAPHVRAILHRRNIGHDFGAYRDGLGALGDVAGLDSVILTNDSCFGPFADLGLVEARAAEGGFDVFGITDSWAHAYHVQSYYLYVGRAVLGSAAFAAFWRGLLISQPRSMVISHGEIGFTQAMLKAGFSAGAMCPYRDVARVARARALSRLGEVGVLPRERAYLADLAEDVDFDVPLNPTYFFWDVLIQHFGSPFLKRDLLRRNLTQQPGLVELDFLGADQAAGVLESLKRA